MSALPLRRRWSALAGEVQRAIDAGDLYGLADALARRDELIPALRAAGGLTRDELRDEAQLSSHARRMRDDLGGELSELRSVRARLGARERGARRPSITSQRV